MAVMDDFELIARRYLAFADQEAHGSSPSYEAWSRAVAGNRDLLARLATLPRRKQQPNLVFAALRWHGEQPGDGESLRHGLLDAWGEVSRTIMGRATQTNEPARCAVLLPLLHRIGGPIALIELGASAGLCLIPDRYSYVYSDGTAVHPLSGPSDVVLRCRVAAGSLPGDLAAPKIVWRAGVDLNPLDPADPDTAAWLTALIWPEHDHRRRRLAAALRLAAAQDVRIGHAGHLVRRGARPSAVRPRERARRHHDAALIADTGLAQQIERLKVSRFPSVCRKDIKTRRACLAKDFDKQDPRVGCGNADREDERERKPVQSATTGRQQGGPGHGIRGHQEQAEGQPEVVGGRLDA
jgi:hypothetical protein